MDTISIFISLERTKMLKRILFTIFVTLLVACSKPIPEFESYGLFVKTSNGYEEVKPISSKQNDIKGLIKPEINKETVKIYVHDPKFNADKIVILQMDMSLKRSNKVEFLIKPQDKKDLYELTLSIKESSMPLLLIRSGGLFSAKSYTLAVGDVEAEAIAAIKNMKSSSHNKLKKVKGFLKSFPDNKELLLMLKELEVKAAEEKATARARQQKKYEQMAYEEAKKSEMRYREKTKWIESYQSFLAQYPTSTYQEAVQQRIEIIRKEINDVQKEYDNQLSKFQKIVGQFVNAVENKDQEKLNAVTVNKSSASQALKSSRLLKANLGDIEVEKFHYSNDKTRNFAYVAIKGADLKRVDLKLTEGTWLISGYSI
ncbi:hypothetical protein [Alkalimarinus alittae]|uniref:DUF4878 domain-containing protein n=1 Tax=Alkalimarinus alittae TaxID=2961619 RepID=A0ABY6N480_9ALTE|nr:hypothetical protein [Alkalimarinus alittae]UZE96810.1 hypothetical protein NKI27_03395 [Alkalimarinus alittae]